MERSIKSLGIMAPIHALLVAQGYEPTRATIASESFGITLACLETPVKYGKSDYKKTINEDQDTYHFVGLVSLNDGSRPEDYYVVGAHMDGMEGGISVNPPTIGLQDFLEKIGSQNVMEFLDSLPRDLQADYSKVPAIRPDPQ